MKRILASLALCIPFYLVAQGFGIFGKDQPYFSDDTTSASLPPAPDTIPGLSYWWDFTDAAKTTITSGKYEEVLNKGYYTSDKVVQTTANLRPIVTTYNGYNVGGFYGTNWLKQTVAWANTNGGKVSVFIVSQINTAGNQLPFCIGDIGSPGLGITYAILYSDGFWEGAAASSVYSTDKLSLNSTNAVSDFIWNFDYSVASNEVTNWWNNIEGTTRTLNGNNAAGIGNISYYEIGGCRSSGVEGSLPVTNGKIFEVGVFDHTLTPTQRATLRTYWTAKYGY